MTLFSQNWLAGSILRSVEVNVESQLGRVLNIWRDNPDHDIQAAIAHAWNRLDEARLAVKDAVQLIKENS